MDHPRESSKTTLSVCMSGIALWVLILLAAQVNGLPYGPHPPETESGFSFKNFKDFVMAGITPEIHTHDPAEMYMHKGQEPAVAQVGVASPAEGQKLLEKEVGVDNQGGADPPHSNDDQPAEIVLVVGEDGEAIQEMQQPKPEEEAVETLDVPHEHPKMEFSSDVIGDKNLVVGEQVMEELPDAKVMAVREEI